MISRCRTVFRVVIACIILLAAVGPLVAEDRPAPPPLDIGENAKPVSLLGHLMMLRDVSGHLSLQDVAFGAESALFSAAPRIIFFGYASDAYWFKVTVRNQRFNRGDLYLWLQPNFVDNIDVFYPRVPAPRGVTDFHEIRLGDHVAVGPGTGHAPFQFAALEPVPSPVFDIYIRVHTGSSLTLAAWLGSSSAFANMAASRSFALGFGFAFFITLALIIMLAWSRSRSPVLLWFALFVLGFSVNVFPLSGFGLSWMRELSPELPDQFCQFAILICHFFGLGYMGSQANLRACCPHLHQLNRAAMGFVACGLLLSLLGYYRFYIPWELIIVSIMLAIFTYLNIRHALTAKSGARMAAIGCSFYAVAAISYHAALLGVFAPTTDLMAFISFGNIIFVALMAISLLQESARLEYLRRESQLLEVSRRAERRAAELVEARTAELLSAKEAAERALEQERAAQAEQLRFVDVVTHQYRTPLAVIRTCVTAIRYATPVEDSANRRRIGQIEAAVQRLVEMMDISLHRSRIGGNVVEANRREVEIVPTISALLQRFRDLHLERQINVSFEGLEPSERLMLDTDMAAIAIGNLIDNAAKFSPSSTAIEVRVSRVGARVHIEVCDEGRGIPEGEIGKVGQRYFRASNSGGIFGTGLGISIVRQVAKAHGGRFRIANRAGGGAVALIALPALSG